MVTFFRKTLDKTHTLYCETSSGLHLVSWQGERKMASKDSSERAGKGQELEEALGRLDISVSAPVASACAGDEAESVRASPHVDHREHAHDAEEDTSDIAGDAESVEDCNVIEESELGDGQDTSDALLVEESETDTLKAEESESAGSDEEDPILLAYEKEIYAHSEYTEESVQDGQLGAEQISDGVHVDQCSSEAAEREGALEDSEEASDAEEDPLSDEVKLLYRKLAIGSLPRYRPQAIINLFEYYAVGHDRALSSLAGIVYKPKSLVDVLKKRDTHLLLDFSVYEEEDGGDQFITLASLTAAERQELNFYYGGFGDCRHVYMTLHDLGNQLEAGTANIQTGNRVHFLLNDNNPAILARCLVVLYALHDLAAKSADEIRQGSASNGQILEMFTYLHFVWFSPVVPVYVQAKLIDVIKRILANSTFHRSIILSPSARSKVESVLRIWLCLLETSSPLDGQAQLLIKAFRRRRESTLPSNRESHVQERVTNCTRWTRMHNIGRDLDAQAQKVEKELTRTAQEYVLSIQNSAFETRFKSVIPDVVFTVAHEILPPPVSLLNRHSKKLQDIHALAMDHVCLVPPEVMLEVGVGAQISETILAGFDPQTLPGEYVINYTAVNPVITDPELSRAHPNENYQVANAWNPLQFMSAVFTSKVFDPPASCTTLFGLSCHFWEKAAFAVRHLLADSGSSLCFEIVDGDMNEVARNIALEGDDRRTSQLPSHFLRAFTSNVPDYTGLLYPLLDIAPLLLPSPKAFIRLSVMYNKTYYQYRGGPQEFLRYKLVMQPGQLQLMRDLYGCNLLDGSQIPHFLFLGKELVSNDQRNSNMNSDQLLHYLLDVFMAVALPPIQRPLKSSFGHFFHHFPESLVVFMELLLTLSNRDVNPEFLANVVEEILRRTGRIVNPRAPTASIDEIPHYEDAHVSFRPFLMEFLTLLSFYTPLFKFSINPAFEIPNCDEIRQYNLVWSAEDFHGNYCYSLNIGLVIFPKCLLGHTPRQMAVNDGAHNTQLAELAHFFSVFRWDSVSRTAFISLPARYFDSLVTDDYKVMVFDTCLWKVVAEPIDLRRAAHNPNEE